MILFFCHILGRDNMRRLLSSHCFRSAPENSEDNVEPEDVESYMQNMHSSLLHGILDLDKVFL